MTSASGRPPYRAAALVAFAVLAVYVASLAPTVTFWDAGEFIAAMKVLGIPHPPGTPLFVMLGHVWAKLIPFGEYAWRTNLMSAVFSAAAGGMWFLVVHESLGGTPDRPDRGTSARLGAAAAVLFSAFAFTTWQNSNETEVYGVSTFLIALCAWLALRWRAYRGTRRAGAVQLLVVYLQALAVANHLLALLAGPALLGFMAYTLRASPAAGAGERRDEWARLGVMAGAWALLLGTGLGSTGLFLLGAVAFAAALVFAARAGRAAFALAALALAVIGVSPYLFLLIRSGQHPPLNEAQPDTWQSLLAVIRREQYGIRTPFDDPTVLHGPDNPGRSLTIIWLQVQTYLLYWVWQWAKGVGNLLGQGAVFVAMLALGVRGSLVQRRSDRGAWWLMFLTWLITGVGLVVYMNFRPGFSIGYDQFPSPSDHEVRERDYFYIVSFVVWGLWAGIGLGDAASRLARRSSGVARRRLHPASALLLLSIAPIALNWREASRSTGADRTLAADFAYNLLNSAPPYAVLYTYGDNDTFPLWWAQEVAGIRRDVTIVCLALAQTDWYMRQLRDAPVRAFDAASAPEVWRQRPAARPQGPLHAMTDEEIATVASSPVMLDRDMNVPVGPLSATLQRGRVLYPNDIASLRILQQNLGRRPIVWALTTGDAYLGLRAYVVQRGLGFELLTARPDTAGGTMVAGGIGNVPFDFPLTDTLAWQTYRYGDLLTRDTRRLESTSASMASSLSIPFTLLAFQYDRLGDTAKVIENLERADRIAPNEAIEAALRGVRGR